MRGGEGLVERHAEVAALVEAVAAAASGRGGLVLLSGPAGIGKTSLLRTARNAAEDAGLTVLTARGADLDQGLAFGVLRQLLLRAAQHAAPSPMPGPTRAARVALGLDDSAEPPGLAQVAHGVYWLVADLAEQGPLALLVDDLHWADPASRLALAHVGAHVADLPVLLVAALRGDPASAVDLERALRSEGSRELPVPPLSPAAVLARARAVDVGATATFAESLHRVSGGVPFYVGELLTQLRQHGGRCDDEAAARLEGLSTPALRRNVLARVAALDAAAQRVARAVAVLPLGADADVLLAVAGVGPAEGRAAVAALVNAHVLTDGERVDVRHPVVRTALYEDLPVLERAALHARAADVLSGRGAPLDEVAGHLLRTVPAGNERAALLLHRAGVAAQQAGAADAASRYLRRGLAEPPASARRWSVLADLGRAAVALGDLRAVQHLEEAFATAPDEDARALVVTDLADVLSRHTDRRRDALDLLWRVIDELDPRDDRRLALLAHVYMAADHSEQAHVDRVIAALPDDLAGRTPAERACLYAAVEREFTTGTVEEVRAVLRRARPGRQTVDDAGPADGWGTYAVTILRSAGQLVLAEEVARGLVERTAAAGQRLAHARTLTGHASLLLRLGRIAEAEARAGTAHALLEGAPVGVEPALTAGWYALALVERDRVAEAGAVLAAFPATAPDRQTRAYLARARSAVAWAAGRVDEAADEAAAYVGWVAATSYANPATMTWGDDAAVRLAEAGRRDEARALLEPMLARARSFRLAPVLGYVLRARGLVEDDVEAVQESVALLAASDFRLEHLKSVLATGTVLARTGHRDAAREPLREALRLARSMGALLLARRAADELRAAGGRAVGRATTGAEALTAGELRVCTLAAAGAMNKQIAHQLYVSLGTVEMHLSNAYRKLSITSRRELAVALEAAPG